MKKTFLVYVFSLVLFGVFITGCTPKVKDTEVRTSAQTTLQSNPSFSGVTVEVTDGVAILSGQVSDEASKAAAEKAVKDVKGVKSVNNNITVVVPVPVEVSTDDQLNISVRDAIKDHPGVNATVSAGVITLTGEINRSDLPTLMQKLNALNPKKVENNLTIK